MSLGSLRRVLCRGFGVAKVRKKSLGFEINSGIKGFGMARCGNIKA